MNWHHLDSKEVLELTSSSSSGLTSATAALKLAEYGPNELAGKSKKPAWKILVNQFTDFMILVLLAAAIIAGIAGDLTDTIIILVIVILNALIGFVQEYQAEKAINALKKMAALQAGVLRNGKPLNIPSAEVVPGDIVLLEAGNMVPADMRLLESFALNIDESALTGESVPANKMIQRLEEAELPLGDRLNMCFKGTIVKSGRGNGVVVATGMQTEIGLIAKLLQQSETVTPLQKRMADFGRKLSYIILIICLFLFGIGLLRGEAPLNMLLIAISLAVAAIPEALPALISIALALGAKRLVRKNALVRKLPSVETLGSVAYICSDKTGTLTQNKMKVVQVMAEKVFDEINATVPFFDLCMALNHDVKETEKQVLMGDPTETALVDYFIAQHSQSFLYELQDKMPRVAELSFDSDRRCMTTVHRYGDKYLVVSKGAVESILAACKSNTDVQKISAAAENWANEGLRVIAYACKFIEQLPVPFSYEMLETGLEFAGLAGMIDPPREEVKKAIEECKTAGIKPVMITGDHPATAVAIARKIGIISEEGICITGKELQALSDESFLEKVEHISVYARVSPEQKLKIVHALQQKNYFVAMTGDGVNDAPSLKLANIGIAMGINGTDVSKEAADMILLDDNFATIVRAVKEGRRIYDNIRKFVKYIMTCNSAEIWTLFLAPIIGLPIPLLPIHILWINLVTDGLPGLALAGEKSERDIMKRLPRKTNESFFADGIGFHIIWVGLLMAAVTLGIQGWSIYQGSQNWQTMVFTVLSLSQLGHVLAIRSEREFLYKQGIFSNLFLTGIVLITFLLQLGVIYLPFANEIFRTKPLSLNELLICIGLSAIVFHAVEMEKYIKVKRRK